MNQSGNVQINGDGNAVGNNNHILVDKRIFHTITHQPPPGPPSGEGGPSSGVNPIGLAILVLVGIAIAAWKFAAYADQIYLAGIVSSLLIAGAQLVALGIGLWRNIPTSWLVDRLEGLFAASALFIAFYWSRQAFPEELSHVAVSATGWQGFMCNLSDLGQQVATIHTLSISLLAVPGLIFAATNSTGALSATIFFVTGWHWAGRTAVVVGGRGLIFWAFLIAIAAVASQTSAAFDVWKNDVFTVKQNPFSTTTKGFKLCHPTAR